MVQTYLYVYLHCKSIKPQVKQELPDKPSVYGDHTPWQLVSCYISIDVYNMISSNLAVLKNCSDIMPKIVVNQLVNIKGQHYKMKYTYQNIYAFLIFDRNFNNEKYNTN